MRALLLLVVALLWCLLLASACTRFTHLAQAPHRARHTYHRAQRRHQHLRQHTQPTALPWN